MESAEVKEFGPESKGINMPRVNEYHSNERVVKRGRDNLM